MNTTTTTTDHPTEVRDATPLWRGAGVTAVAAILFPRLNAVMYDHQKIWELDREAAVLIPIAIVVCLALFATVGLWAWRGRDNRPAVVGLVVGALGLVGILAFFISAPIMLGGLATTLGLEGIHRAQHDGRLVAARVATGLGVLAILVGAVIWLVGV